MNDELVDYRNAGWRVRLTLIGITAVGAGIRCQPVPESLWLDELHTSWVVSGRLSEIVPRARQGNQSPLYFWGVWGITRLMGQSELSLRLPSLLAGLLLIPAVFVVSTKWSGSSIAGLLAAALVATEQQFLFYSTEARPYALVQLVGLVQVALFARVHACVGDASRPSVPSNYGPRLLLIVSSVALFYLHYTAALIFVAEAAAFLVVIGTTAVRAKAKPGRSAPRVIAIALDFAAVSALCLPAAQNLWQIAEHRQQWDILKTSLPMVDIGRVIAICLGLPLLFAVPLTALRRLLGKRPSLIQPSWNALILTFHWMLLPGLLVVACKPWANLVLLRYIIVSAAAPMVLAALIAATQVNRRRQIAVAMTVLSAAVLSAPWLAALVRNQRTVPDRNEIWRDLVAMINTDARSKEEPVFVCSGLVEDGRLSETADREFREYCLFPVSGIYTVDRGSRTVQPIPTSISTYGTSRLTEDDVGKIASAGGAWLIVRGPGSFADWVEYDLLSTVNTSGAAARRRSRHAFGFLTAIRIGVEN